MTNDLLFSLSQTPPEQVVMIAHMGGEPMTITLGDWLQLDMNQWQVAIATPGLDIKEDLNDLRSFELKDSEGLLLEPADPSSQDKTKEMSTGNEVKPSTYPVDAIV